MNPAFVNIIDVQPTIFPFSRKLLQDGNEGVKADVELRVPQVSRNGFNGKEVVDKVEQDPGSFVENTPLGQLSAVDTQSIEKEESEEAFEIPNQVLNPEADPPEESLPEVRFSLRMN